MRALAHAPDVHEFDDKLEDLKSSTAWRTVGQYLTQTWLPCKEVNYFFTVTAVLFQNYDVKHEKFVFILIMRVTEVFVMNKTQ